MNKQERFEMIKAMETIARCVNDEDIFELWLRDGVADGDINEDTTPDDLESYMEDDEFSDLMTTFLIVMKYAYQDGLYCDDILSK